ncbi:hypothetical protein AZE42_11483 [Rhizopogon vesiculosus]|uniref:MIF4G domain-containing protein n=1 Tax=Rhizopogon vesiculosus TaxID=180088 RepID=A0A1J8QG03_9AGAM|nr:hypothetical protein AZE42_11483 [Rhizopogon vesiculosus]
MSIATDSRHDITSTLTNLIIDSISSHSTLLDSYAVLHAAFISSFYRLPLNAVASYERRLASVEEKSTPNTTEVAEDLGKECSNLVVLFSELYNFQVISCILIYDIIHSLLADDLSGFRVELLLKLLQNSGQQLRQDDPT